MPISPTSKRIRKRFATKFGRNTALLHVGRRHEVFTIHEDLLCTNSPFFRNILQPQRKAVEGDCSICHEELQPGAEELTYCMASCGGNFHYACIEQWKGQAPTRGTTQCPLCRQKWKIPKATKVHRLTDLDPDCFDVYTEWLYSTRLDIFDTHKDIATLIKAYSLGNHLRDRIFCLKVLEALSRAHRNNDVLPDLAHIKLAYDNTVIPSSLRRFMIGLCTGLNSKDLRPIFHNWEAYPTSFTRDLLKAFVKDAEDFRQTDSRSTEDEGDEVNEGEDGDDDVVED